MQALRVLVVDDVAVVRDAMRELLAELGINNVALAADSAGVTEALAQGPIGLAFAAVGPFAEEHPAAQVKAAYPMAHVVLLATSDDVNAARVATAVGARALMVKPWTAAQVSAIVARCQRENA
jgi:DNA-binding NtrC family response regulator